MDNLTVFRKSSGTSFASFHTARIHAGESVTTVNGGNCDRRSFSRPDRRGRYTLHLTFTAADFDAAREQAVAYAEGLTVLRPELGDFTPLLSRAEAWNFTESLFCGVRRPDGEMCAEVRYHAGPHRAAGRGGLSWGDGDVDVDVDLAVPPAA